MNGKADEKLTSEDLLALAPTSKNNGVNGEPWYEIIDRSLLVVADVNETATGITLSGNAAVNLRQEKYHLAFLDFTPGNFKPGLLYTAFVSSIALLFTKL